MQRTVSTNSPSWWSNPRLLLRSILMLDDTPHSIALGTALGMFIGITPTGGIQMLLVVALSLTLGRIFRFNRLAALLMVYVSNPITAVPLYWFCYQVGAVFLGADLTKEDFTRIFQYESFDQWSTEFFGLLVDIGGPLLLGSLIVATVAAIVTYPIMLWLLESRTGSGNKRVVEEKPQPVAMSTK